VVGGRPIDGWMDGWMPTPPACAWTRLLFAFWSLVPACLPACLPLCRGEREPVGWTDRICYVGSWLCGVVWCGVRASVCLSMCVVCRLHSWRRVDGSCIAGGVSCVRTCGRCEGTPSTTPPTNNRETQGRGGDTDDRRACLVLCLVLNARIRPRLFRVLPVNVDAGS